MDELEREIAALMRTTIATKDRDDFLRKIHGNYEDECVKTCEEIRERYMIIERDFLKGLINQTGGTG